jgi:hypothetical protein
MTDGSGGPPVGGLPPVGLVHVGRHAVTPIRFGRVRPWSGNIGGRGKPPALCRHERDQRLQQSVADEGYQAPDQRKQPLLPTPESGKDSAEQNAPSVLGPPRKRSPQLSTVTALERFAGASGGAPTGTEGEAVCGPDYPARRGR